MCMCWICSSCPTLWVYYTLHSSSCPTLWLYYTLYSCQAE